MFAIPLAVVAAVLTGGDPDYVLPGSTGAVAVSAVKADASRMSWLDSTAGVGDAPTRPFTPVRVDAAARTVQILGRELVLGENGLPVRVRSFFNGSNTRTDSAPTELLACPVSFAGAVRGGGFRFIENTPCRASWTAFAEADGWRCRVEGSLSFDGFAAFRIVPEASRPVAITPTLTFDIPREVARYAMGLGLVGGDFPASLDWKWDVSKQQDALWFGRVNAGAMIRLKGANWRRPHVNVYYKWRTLNLPETWGTGGVRITTDSSAAHIAAYGAPFELKPGDRPLYAFDMYLTPFKPIDVASRFAARHLHLMQRNDKVDFAAVRKKGATVLTFHHNTVWNPYINYPLNEDGGPLLKKAIADAHEVGLRVRCYYTTRELSHNVPEFAALTALGGEIFARKPKGDGSWPVTNPNGPNQWLVEHAGGDILPAWHETISFDAYPHRLDLAVITQPDSRWNNFYLEGLRHLVEDYGLDGIYLDDCALNRDALMRARRILDADGRTDRIIDLHSWNHHRDLAGEGNSAVIYMELMPYLDQLWFGESFKFDEPDAFWLVERSGIPFGLMGEVLQMGDVYCPFRAFLYGMTNRWGDKGHPQALWRMMDELGLGESEFVGYWDEANPVRVKCDATEDVKASVFRRPGMALVVVADFALKGYRKCSLEVDWAALGIAPERAVWSMPSSAGVAIGWMEDPTSGFTINPMPKRPAGAFFVVSHATP